MPARKRPKLLESICLECVGEKIFLNTISRVVRRILKLYLQEYAGNSKQETESSRRELGNIMLEYGLDELCLEQHNNEKNGHQYKLSFKIIAMQMVEDCITQLQKCLFVETVHYYHSRIAQECMVIVH